MLCYLYWKQPTNPLLKHFEKTLVIKLFKDIKSIDLINNTKLPPTDSVGDITQHPQSSHYGEDSRTIEDMQGRYEPCYLVTIQLTNFCCTVTLQRLTIIQD